MTGKYAIEAEDDSIYILIDESFLWHPDTWILMVRGERRVVFSFGEHVVIERQDDADDAGTRPTERKWKTLDRGVGRNLRSGACLGQQVMHLPEDVLKPYMQTRELPPEVWDQLQQLAGWTSRIRSVYAQVSGK